MIDVKALKQEGAKGRLKEMARQRLWEAKILIEDAQKDDFKDFQNNIESALSKIEDARIALEAAAKI